MAEDAIRGDTSGADRSSGEPPASLVARYLAGDELAFADIYRRYSTELFHFAYRSIGDADQAADVTSSTFSLAAARLAKLRDPSKLRAWLYAVMRNEIHHLLRSATRERRRVERLATLSPPEVPVAVPGDDEVEEGDPELARSVLVAARSGLSEDDQLLLGLVLSGLSSIEIAEALAIDVGAANTRKSRLYDRLRLSVESLWAMTRGRRECAALDELLRRRDERELTRTLSRAIGRHFETCSLCDKRRRKLSPLGLLAAAPLPALPARLAWQHVAASLAAVHPSSGGGSGGGGSGGGGTAAGSPGAAAGASLDDPDLAARRQVRDRGWRPDGFPEPAAGGSHRSAAWLAAVAAVVVAIVLSQSLHGSGRPAALASKTGRSGAATTTVRHPGGRTPFHHHHHRTPTATSSTTSTRPAASTSTSSTTVGATSTVAVTTTALVATTASEATTAPSNTAAALPSTVAPRRLPHHPRRRGAGASAHHRTTTTVAPATTSPRVSTTLVPEHGGTRHRYRPVVSQRPPTTLPHATTTVPRKPPARPTTSVARRSTTSTSMAATTTSSPRRRPRPTATSTSTTVATSTSTSTSTSSTTSTSSSTTSTSSTSTSTSSTTTTSATTSTVPTSDEPQISDLQGGPVPGECAASFSAVVTDPAQLSAVDLVYGDSAAAKQTAAMSPTFAPTTYSSGPLAFPAGSVVTWAVTATDSLGRTVTVDAPAPVDVC